MIMEPREYGETWREDLERRAILATHVPSHRLDTALRSNEALAREYMQLARRNNRNNRAFKGACIIGAVWLVMGAIGWLIVIFK